MFKCTSRSSSGIEYSHRIKTHRVGESRRRECSPAEVEEAGRTSSVIKLDLPKLRIGALKGTPGVAGAVGYLVDTDVQGRHCRKPVFFITVYYSTGSHTHKLTARPSVHRHAWAHSPWLPSSAISRERVCHMHAQLQLNQTNNHRWAQGRPMDATFSFSSLAANFRVPKSVSQRTTLGPKGWAL